MIKKIGFVVGLMVATLATAQPNSTPSNCITSSFIIANQQLVLNLNSKDKKPHLFLLHNTSKQKIWLNHLTNRSASAGWGSQVSPGNWSAILQDTANFALSCQQYTATGTVTLNCAKVLAVCERQDFVIPQGDVSHYWVSENLPFIKLTAAMAKRGFTQIDQSHS